MKKILAFCLLLLSLKGYSQKRPNIIVILADDMGLGDIVAFNPESKIKTPNLDKMAWEGMRFTDAHSSSSVCTPTRYGLITGRYNWRSHLKNGVLTGTSKALIENGRTTIASLLKAQNYQTAFIGKWHLGWDWALKVDSLGLGTGWDPSDCDNIDFSKPIKNGPETFGFTYSYGHAGSLDMAPYVYVENSKVTTLPNRNTVNTGKYSWWREGPTAQDFIHEGVTPHFFEKSMGYIQQASNNENPFFLYLALPSPHTPILPIKDFQGKSGLNPYADFVMQVDFHVGQLLEFIKNAGIEENTLVIFTSDNGMSPAGKIEELTEKGHNPSYIYRGHKADIFEGGHRVPFIVKWPEFIPKASMYNQTICLNDLMATFAELNNYKLKENEGEDSYSLMPAFSEKKEKIRQATVHHSINGSFAIRKDDWKLILCAGSGGWSFPKPDSEEEKGLPEVQLYNLKNDPGETRNLESEYPKKVKELKKLLEKYIEEGRSTKGKAQQNDGAVLISEKIENPNIK